MFKCFREKHTLPDWLDATRCCRPEWMRALGSQPAGDGLADYWFYWFTPPLQDCLSARGADFVTIDCDQAGPAEILQALSGIVRCPEDAAIARVAAEVLPVVHAEPNAAAFLQDFVPGIQAFLDLRQMITGVELRWGELPTW